MELVLIVLCVFLAAIWIFLIATAGKRFEAYLEPLDTKKYMLKALYPIGFRILEMIKYSYSTSHDRIRLNQARIVFGEKYGEYYYRVNMAEKFTYLAMFVTLAPALGLFFKNPLAAGFSIVAGAVMYYYADTKITDIIKKRETEIGSSFADVVSKMALLINAGMITREAWQKISETGEDTLYIEMRQSVLDMNNGMSEIDAYIAFGTRCGVPLIRKFISMLVQNLSKGNKELVDFLKEETEVFWEEKKHIVRRKGEAASNKMMIPLGLILIGIFIMILVPIVSNLNI